MRTPTWEKDAATGLYRCLLCSGAELFNPALEHHECPAPVVDQVVEPEQIAPPKTPASALGGYTAEQIRDRQARLIDEFDAALDALANPKNARQAQRAQSRIKGLEMLRRSLATAYASALDREQIELLEEFKRYAELIARSRGTWGPT